MDLPERPKLRPYLTAARADYSGRRYVVWDRLQFNRRKLEVSEVELSWLKLFDGSRSLRDIQADAVRLAGGVLVPLDAFEQLTGRLDAVLFLDTPVRPPHCAGIVYDEDPEGLRRQLRRLFTGPGGPGMPGEAGRDDSLRAVLAPHIDYPRGGAGYGWAFKELFEHTRADLFVIIATSHNSPARFTLTRKHFRTPLGVVETDGAFIDRLVARYGDGLFDDEWLAHFPEHSVELEVVLLHFLYEKRPFRIVPLVVGSFRDRIATGGPPGEADDI